MTHQHGTGVKRTEVKTKKKSKGLIAELVCVCMCAGLIPRGKKVTILP